MPTGHPSSMSGRHAQAARNDQLIREAARKVFIADPHAPIADVARAAGVGISALYTRYPSKDDLLQTLCANGLERFVEETEAALADDRDPWTVFVDYIGRLVDAETSSLTRGLAGTFTPTNEMFRLAQRADELLRKLFRRVKPELRPGVEVHDVSLVFELVAAVRVSDPARTSQLRRRYLAVILDGLRARDGGRLPGPGPSWQELSARWNP